MRSKLGLPARLSCWVLLLVAVLGHAALAVLAVGIWPAPLLKVMQPTIHHLLTQAIATKL